MRQLLAEIILNAQKGYLAMEQKEPVARSYTEDIRESDRKSVV